MDSTIKLMSMEIMEYQPLQGGGYRAQKCPSVHAALDFRVGECWGWGPNKIRSGSGRLVRSGSLALTVKLFHPYQMWL